MLFQKDIILAKYFHNVPRMLRSFAAATTALVAACAGPSNNHIVGGGFITPEAPGVTQIIQTILSSYGVRQNELFCAGNTAQAAWLEGLIFLGKELVDRGQNPYAQVSVNEGGLLYNSWNHAVDHRDGRPPNETISILIKEPLSAKNKEITLVALQKLKDCAWLLLGRNKDRTYLVLSRDPASEPAFFVIKGMDGNYYHAGPAIPRDSAIKLLQSALKP
jgi:hypothetical protein